MAQRPVPREPGEGIKLVGFRAPLSLDAQIEERALAAGMTKSDWLRAVLAKVLAADEEVAA